jgi:predicted DNA binding CopG/RHH family protein
MAKKTRQTSPRRKHRKTHPTHKPNNKLNLSAIPEATDQQLRRVGRPATGNAKQLIAIRIAPKLLSRLRRLAAKQSKPYQTLIHKLLERATIKGLGKFRSGIPDPCSNKKHLRDLGR